MADVIDGFTARRSHQLAEERAQADWDGLQNGAFDNEAYQRDFLREMALPRARLTDEASAGLRRQLLEHADKPGDAVLPVSALYAMNRELLQQRATQLSLIGIWAAYQRGESSREVFENDIRLLAADIADDQKLETITDPEVVLAGTVELG
jgi:hypothetical protein